jgi:hypothetical protein
MDGAWRISDHFLTDRLIYPLYEPIHKLMTPPCGGGVGGKGKVTKYVYISVQVVGLAAYLKIQIPILVLGVKSLFDSLNNIYCKKKTRYMSRNKGLRC